MSSVIASKNIFIVYRRVQNNKTRVKIRHNVFNTLGNKVSCILLAFILPIPETTKLLFGSRVILSVLTAK